MEEGRRARGERGGLGKGRRKRGKRRSKRGGPKGRSKREWCERGGGLLEITHLATACVVGGGMVMDR